MKHLLYLDKYILNSLLVDTKCVASKADKHMNRHDLLQAGTD
jgi:hypothetical protein